MGVDGHNPAFQQAIPHGTVVFGLLPKVVIFGSSWESRNGLIWGPEMVSFGDRKWIHLVTQDGFTLGAICGPEN